jgi:anti-sigma28 factor (negative regulator of flagellin synthesis)
MEIRGITPKIFQNDDKVKSQSEKTPEQSKKDKIEISEEAKALQSNSTDKKLSEIREKIGSGYYNTDEVLQKVAESILKEIGK